MNCIHCNKLIQDKPWLHLSEKDNSEIDKYICGYSCFKRSKESNILPKNYTIVNKEDYEGLICPVIRKKQKIFEYLTLNEIRELTDIEREKYYLEADNQIYINPILYEIHNEIINEDKYSDMIENNISDSELIDDY